MTNDFSIEELTINAHQCSCLVRLKYLKIYGLSDNQLARYRAMEKDAKTRTGSEIYCRTDRTAH